MALTTIKTGGLADNSVTDAKVANAITVTGAQTGITQVGTLTAGTWNAGVIASDKLDADTAHLSTTQTFSGAKTFSTYIQLNPSASTSSYLQFATGGSTYGYVGSESSIVSGGTASDMTIGASGNTNLTLTTNGAIRATLNSSGATFAGNITMGDGKTIIGTTDGTNFGTLIGTDTSANNIVIGSTSVQYYNDIVFNSAGATGDEILRMKADGKVGINTDSPAEKLNVNGDTRLDGKLGIGKSPQSGYEFDMEVSSGNANMRLKATGTNQGVRLDLDHHSGDKAEVHFYNGGHSSTAIVSNEITNGLIFKVGGTSGASKVDAVKIESDGDMITRRIMPVSDGDRDLGDNTKSWRKVYTDKILFNGDTADANALADYEEGTFDPIMEGQTNQGSFTYVAQVGRYTKIGRMVQIQIYINISACLSVPSGNYMFIRGLPFTNSNDAGVSEGSTFSMNYWTLESSVGTPTGFIYRNNSGILLTRSNASGGTIVGVLTPSEWASSATSMSRNLYGSATYYVD